MSSKLIILKKSMPLVRTGEGGNPAKTAVSLSPSFSVFQQRHDFARTANPQAILPFVRLLANLSPSNDEKHAYLFHFWSST